MQASKFKRIMINTRSLDFGTQVVEIKQPEYQGLVRIQENWINSSSTVGKSSDLANLQAGQFSRSLILKTIFKPIPGPTANLWVFSKAALTDAHGRETHKSVWVACAYNLHSLLHYITISQTEPHWTHEIPMVGGCEFLCASHSGIIKFKTSPPPSCCLHSDSQMLCSAPPLHMHASPEGRGERPLLPFPPAAAENNQRHKTPGNTKTVPRDCSQRNEQLCTHA